MAPMAKSSVQRRSVFIVTPEIGRRAMAALHQAKMISVN
jgi:hypothetical protein